MNDRTSKASDMAMKGDGYYSLFTKGAKDVIDAATPLVLEALGAMGLDKGTGAVTLADFGCADGGTSVDMVRAAVSAISSLAPRRPVAIYYTDQLRNDYNALFRIAHKELGQADHPIHIFASATGFYEQVLPAGTLDLGFSATAMHWLSGKPRDITGHVHAVGAHGEELQAFAEQGGRDWETILLRRAEELRPGGRLVLANFCKDQEGRYLGNTGGVHMFDTFNRLWRDLVAEGTVEEDEYQAMTLPQYYKTVEEFTAPLTDSDGPVYQAGLRLEGIETRVTPCPYAVDFRRHRDPERFAESYIPTLRSWTESTFFAGLSARRSMAERREIVDRYYRRYEALVAGAPAGHAMDYVHAFMTLRKEG